MSDLTDGSGNYEYTVDNQDGTETVYDPMVGTYTQSTSPFSTNPTNPYDIEIQVQIGVQSAVREDEHQWRQTNTYTIPFFLTTSTQKFGSDIPSLASKVWDYVQSEVSKGAVIQLHSAVWLDNFTHPPLSAGVVRLPKGHRDVTYTQLELTSADWLTERLNNICSDLKNIAKY